MKNYILDTACVLACLLQYYMQRCLLESQSLTSAEVDPLENLLIEHPSMSVYNMMSQRTEEEDLTSDEEEEGSPRCVKCSSIRSFCPKL